MRRIVVFFSSIIEVLVFKHIISLFLIMLLWSISGMFFHETVSEAINKMNRIDKTILYLSFCTLCICVFGYIYSVAKRKLKQVKIWSVCFIVLYILFGILLKFLNIIQ